MPLVLGRHPRILRSFGNGLVWRRISTTTRKTLRQQFAHCRNFSRLIPHGCGVPNTSPPSAQRKRAYPLLPDHLKPFHVVCDASNFAIGCALMQYDEGRERVVSSSSVSLNQPNAIAPFTTRYCWQCGILSPNSVSTSARPTSLPMRFRVGQTTCNTVATPLVTKMMTSAQ